MTAAVEDPAASGADRSETFCPKRNRRYVLATAILASALGFIDGSVVSIAIPAIRADLGANLSDAQWISNAYMLMLSAFMLVGGAVGDRIGLKRAFAGGIAVFVIASVVCAIVPDPGSLIAARTVQGIGAAFMVPASLAIIAKAYPARERGQAIGIWAAASALMTAVGPVVGGLVLSSGLDYAWRLIFAVNLPLGAIALYLLIFRVPPDAPSERKPIDFPGAFLATAALGLIAFALTALNPNGEEGLSVGGGVAAAAVVGVVAFAAFLAWEARSAHPMIRLSLFSIRAFSAANIVTFLLYFALSAVLFFLPMTLIAGWGLPEAETGFVFVPMTLAIAFLSGWAGRLADRIGPRLLIGSGCAVVAIAYAALGAGMGLQSFWYHVLPLMLVMGLGMALVVSPLSTAVMTSVEDADTGAASGINNAVSRVAGLVAVAAVGALASAVFAAALSAEPQLAQSVGAGFGEPVEGELSSEAEALRVAATNAAFAAIAYFTAALCALAALIGFWLIPARTGPAGSTGPAPAG